MQAASLLPRIRSWLVIVALVGFTSQMQAQRADTLSLGEVLQRLEANLNHYDADVPSVFCDEV